MTLCSNCQAHVRPVLAVDIDGTLAEYHHSLLNHCIQYLGLPPGTHQTYDWDGYGNYEDYIGISQADYREAKLAYRQGGFKRWAPSYPGLPFFTRGVSYLRARYNLEVWVTTTRPWLRLDNVDPDTRFWLDRNFPDYDYLLYDESKYERLVERVDPARIVMVLEDLPDMFLAARACIGMDAPVMVERPHNQHFRARYDRAQTATGLDTAVVLLQERVEKWITASEPE